MMFKRILCPVDFSADSRAALEVAAGLARESSGTLVLVHVSQMTQWALGELTMAPQALQGISDSGEQELVRWKAVAQQLGAPTVETRSENGGAWDRIVYLASQDDIDLVVMGTRGRTGLQRVLLGSVAENVVRHAPCSVLVVRADQRTAREQPPAPQRDAAR